MAEEVWKKNPFGLRIAILGKDKPLEGASIGGNKDNVVNPRNTFKEEDIIKRKDAGKWSFEYMNENNTWRNEP